jgi:hypothetical protein
MWQFVGSHHVTHATVVVVIGVQPLRGLCRVKTDVRSESSTLTNNEMNGCMVNGLLTDVIVGSTYAFQPFSIHVVELIGAMNTRAMHHRISPTGQHIRAAVYLITAVALQCGCGEVAGHDSAAKQSEKLAKKFYTSVGKNEECFVTDIFYKMVYSSGGCTM